MNRHIIKKVIPHVFLRLAQDFLYRPVRNLYKTNYKKNVMISYIVHPFRGVDKEYHTNRIESVKISEIFRELEFNVDIYNYDYVGKIDYSAYDVIFGFGTPLCKSFYGRDREIKTIYYGTEMHIFHQNTYTLKRIREVYDKTGQWLPESGRIVENAWSIQTSLVDAMILLGNEAVKETYKNTYGGPIYLLPPSYIEVITISECLDLIRNKNWAESKKHFLWFGSVGMIHKGLDVLLDFFKKEKRLHLHICGPIDLEPAFKKTYHHELYNLDNIHTYGFIYIRSELFKELMRKCGFVIFPSCSEGGGASVLNCMANGLIPILTRFTSINVEKIGEIIQDIDVESVRNAVLKMDGLSEKELKEKSIMTFEYTRNKHNINMYKSELKRIIIGVLDDL